MSTSMPILLRNVKQSAMVFAGLNMRMIAPAIRFLSFIYMHVYVEALCVSVRASRRTSESNSGRFNR